MSNAQKVTYVKLNVLKWSNILNFLTQKNVGLCMWQVWIKKWTRLFADLPRNITNTLFSSELIWNCKWHEKIEWKLSAIESHKLFKRLHRCIPDRVWARINKKCISRRWAKQCRRRALVRGTGNGSISQELSGMVKSEKLLIVILM